MPSLTHLVVGDEVAIPLHRTWGRADIQPPCAIQKVERLTATQLVTDGKARINRANGSIIGSPYAYASPATPEVKAAVELALDNQRRYFAVSKTLDELYRVLGNPKDLTITEREKLAAFWTELRA